MMKETKTCFRFFSIMDYEKEADFLRKMHKKGWKFVKSIAGRILWIRSVRTGRCCLSVGL